MSELTTAVSTVSTAASAISELTVASTKRAATDCEVTNDSDANDQPEWGCNCDNPAIAGRQEHVPKKTRFVQPDFPLTLNGTLLTLVLK
jgi:hypothetical protein